MTLVGHAAINNDVPVKVANWCPESYRCHPGGPEDPNVVYVDFATERIEIWSSSHGVEPDPIKGLWAAVLTRDASDWCQHTGSRGHFTTAMTPASVDVIQAKNKYIVPLGPRT